jgi:hypothetical protein
MPIFSYFAVIGSVLVALLFVADATLEKSGPLPFNNESVGLPKPWHPEPHSSILTGTPAPEPDMTSAAVRAATPPPAKTAEIPAAAAAAQAEAVPAPKKPKRTARKQPRPNGGWRDYAWSRNGNDGFFGGGNSRFGRF